MSIDHRTISRCQNDQINYSQENTLSLNQEWKGQQKPKYRGTTQIKGTNISQEK